jgi:hypothetical protein
VTQYADTAEWRPKQCNILFVDARCWLDRDVFGKLTTEPRDISTISIRDLCLFIRSAGLLTLLKVIQGQHNKPKAAVHTAEMTGPLKNNNQTSDQRSKNVCRACDNVSVATLYKVK